MDTHQLIFHSRAASDADWSCQRQRFYQYNFNGGIVKNNLTLELFFGTCLHDALAAIAHQHSLDGAADIDKIATDSAAFFAKTLTEYYTKGEGELPQTSPNWLLMMEQSTLLEAMLRGFYKQHWPTLIAQYPVVVGYEKETIFPHDFTGKLNKKGPFVYKAKPDLMLAEDQSSPVIYVEHKSTSTKKPEWISSWEYAMQVHGSAKAIEFTLDREVLGTIINGMYKGSTMYGKFSSELVYAYVTKGNPPFNKQVILPGYKAGAKKTPVWELQGGVKAYINQLSPETLSEQFPQTPLIFTNESMAEDFFRQRAMRESKVKDSITLMDTVPDNIKLNIMDEVFPQSFSKCSPSFGRACDFLGLCHGPQSVKDDPIGSGKFAARDREHNSGFRDVAKQLMEGITT